METVTRLLLQQPFFLLIFHILLNNSGVNIFNLKNEGTVFTKINSKMTQKC